MKALFRFVIFILLLSGILHSQVPNLINYQGRVAVDSVNFDGTGQFKFALVNGTSTTAYWSNDGSLSGAITLANQPTSAVARPVIKGLYSVLLGDTSLTNMITVPASVFNNTDVRLRVWFSDGTNGFQLLSPDQRIAAVGYAIVAGSAQSVPDGSITITKIASGAITADKLDPALRDSLGVPDPASNTPFTPVPGFVSVGNPSNIADPRNSAAIPGIGSVAYTFQIGKYEVTNSEYVAFLNAVATTDTNALYSTAMASDARAGIIRTSVSGSYSYSVKVNMGYKPVNYVSFYDAIRYCNWLHNGKPSGTQSNSSTEDGAYAITGSSPNWTVGSRKVGAQFYLPTENEWYKAAYYDPNASGVGVPGYWLYPTNSNDRPIEAQAQVNGDVSNPGVNVANFNSIMYWNRRLGNVSTVGSCGSGSKSAYGAYDMAGNVSEWNETLTVSTSRGLRAGSFSGETGNVQSTSRSSGFEPSGVPSSEKDNWGFRIAKP